MYFLFQSCRKHQVQGELQRLQSLNFFRLHRPFAFFLQVLKKLIEMIFGLATVWALYREIDEVGTITLILWGFTICAILFAVIAGYSTFDSRYIAVPGDAFSDTGKFFVSLGTAARYAVYDFTGYYDVNFVGNFG